MKKLLLAVPAITALLLSGSGCTAKRQQEEQKQIAPNPHTAAPTPSSGQ